MPAGTTHWSELTFKPVNLNAMGSAVTGGNFHPLLKVRAEFRRILMDMGFEEMPTNKWYGIMLILVVIISTATPSIAVDVDANHGHSMLCYIRTFLPLQG